MASKKQEYAVIGLGQFGSSVAVTLAEMGYSVLGIDIDPAISQKMAAQLTQVASLDATDEVALQEIDIAAFDVVVVAIGTDFENSILVATALKNMGLPYVICKAQSNRQRQILYRIGVDRVVQPEIEAGQRLAQELCEAGLLQQLDIGPDYQMAELALPESLIGQTLAQAAVHSRYNLDVMIIKRGLQILTTPAADQPLQRGDILVALGRHEAVVRFRELK